MQCGWLSNLTFITRIDNPRKIFLVFFFSVNATVFYMNCNRSLILRWIYEQTFKRTIIFSVYLLFYDLWYYIYNAQTTITIHTYCYLLPRESNFYISLIVCACILTSICTHSSFHFDCDHIPKLHYHFISAMFGAKSP